MDWEKFVKCFVDEIDYDISKQLYPESAEVPEEAEEFLAELVAAAKLYAKEYLDIKDKSMGYVIDLPDDVGWVLYLDKKSPK